MYKHIRKYSYWYCVLLIVCFAALLRFYAFAMTWSFGGSDGTRDMIIAYESLQRHELPLVGPFSSAGPFVTGPLYFWFLLPGVVFLPLSLSAPFIYFIFLSLVLVFLSFWIGLELGGRKFSLFFGFLCAVSPKLIQNSYSLRNPTLILLCAFLLIYCFLLLSRTKREVFALLIGLAAGLAVNMHYQGLNLLVFLPACFFLTHISWKKRIIFFVLTVVGVMVTMIPVMVWDAQQHFANIRNVLDYFLIGQYRTYVPNSWKLFLFHFLPQTWADVIGGIAPLGFMLYVCVIIYSFWQLGGWKRQKPEELIIPAILIIFLVVNRYYHGIRTEGYVFYLSPLILLCTALFLRSVFRQIARRTKHAALLGLFVLICLTGIQLYSIKDQFQKKTTNIAEIYASADAIQARYPGEKFRLYDASGLSTARSMTISLLLDVRNLESDRGRKLGIDCGKGCLSEQEVYTNGDIGVVDLSSRKALSQSAWQDVSADHVYDSLIGWSKKHALHSTFNLGIYLRHTL